MPNNNNNNNSSSSSSSSSSNKCIIITGHPCSGKTTLAEAIKGRALLMHRRKGQHDDDLNAAAAAATPAEVIIINEQTVCPDKTIAQCYETPSAEKQTRAALKTAFDRAVSSTSSNNSKDGPDEQRKTNTKSKLIILDSLNYIKGYRYELYCIDKTANNTHCVVWCLNGGGLETCRQWNEQRRQRRQDVNQEEEDDYYYYSDELLEELIRRYEPPDERNRWDRPLYKFDMRDPTNTNQEQQQQQQQEGSLNLAGQVLDQSVYNMHQLSEAISSGVGSSKTSSPDNKNNKNTNTSNDGTVAVEEAPVSSSSTAAEQQQTKPIKKTTTKSAFKRASNFKRPNSSSRPSSGTLSSAAAQASSSTSGLATTTMLTAEALSSLSSSKEKKKNSTTTNVLKGGRSTTSQEAMPELPPTHPTTYNEPEAAAEVAAKATAAATTPPPTATQQPQTLEEQIDAFLDSFLLHVQPLSEGFSTRQHVASNANVLHEVDALTQKVVNAILHAQDRSAMGMGRLPVPINDGTLFLSSHNRLLAPELRKVRRQYLQWVINHAPSDTSERGIAESFLAYIETQQ